MSAEFCPSCGADLLPSYMGRVGSLHHFNCRYCGAWSNVPTTNWNPPEPEEEPCES